MKKLFQDIGEYVLLMMRVFRMPDRQRMFWRQLSHELDKQGTQSVPIDLIISIFIGAIMTMQIKLDMANPLLPRYTVGVVTRDTMLLEFSSTILCLILAGKVGSNIASEIGTMRITEQIDAMEIMGVNSANYLILPKIVAFMAMMPILVIFSVGSALIGGYMMALLTDILTVDEYVYGITYAFMTYHVPYAIVKSVIYAYVITSVSAYYGYTTRGGALEVGKASTNAVVNSSVIILFLDIFLTKLMLS
ncbi:MAG: ABC transporter permease [Paludibacteraceae bacterium]|nr:ABC transporter permease [Paludibacteraceae bacterium]MBQ9705672.1 ABC transporter permease [Paludibacteraceae bacterium]